jgi:TolB-like protein/Tfp pilus assembly protein PilF
MSLYAELKRRNVFRVAAAYIVLGWLFLQVSSVVLQFIAAPDWVGKAIIALLVIGFIPGLAIAWVFEVGPDGVKRDDGTTSATSGQHARRLDILTLAGMVVLAIFVMVDNLRVEKKGPADERASESLSSESAPPPATKAAPESVSDTLSPAAPPATALPALTPDPGSIAVLPFANMSPDPENEYFADGIAEELLNILSKVDGLDVASRTSSFSFKGKDHNVGEIARTLNVAHVLEGSVRRQGMRVRITAQLIDSATDKHLWSDTYDRDLTDIFKVQEEIAQAISDALRKVLGVAVTAAAVEVDPPTQDLDAYALFLRGRQAFYRRGTGLTQARQLLEEAVQRDPGFAQAWAVLAGTYYVMPDYLDMRADEAFPLAERAALHARELDAGIGLAWAVLGQVAEHRGDWIEAMRLFDEAIARDPADPTGLLWRGIHWVGIGDFARAEADLAQVLQIDPLSGVAVGWYGIAIALQGDRKRGDAHLQRAAELGWGTVDVMRMRFALADGDRDRAALHLRLNYQRFENVSPASQAVIDAAVAAIRDRAGMDALLAAIDADIDGLNHFGWGTLLGALGAHRPALEFELDARRPPSRNFHRMIWFPTARGLIEDPIYVQVAERDGLLAYWRAKGFPSGCRLIEQPERRIDCSERWRAMGQAEAG